MHSTSIAKQAFSLYKLLSMFSFWGLFHYSRRFCGKNHPNRPSRDSNPGPLKRVNDALQLHHFLPLPIFMLHFSPHLSMVILQYEYVITHPMRCFISSEYNLIFQGENFYLCRSRSFNLEVEHCCLDMWHILQY